MWVSDGNVPHAFRRRYVAGPKHSRPSARLACRSSVCAGDEPSAPAWALKRKGQRSRHLPAMAVPLLPPLLPAAPRLLAGQLPRPCSRSSSKRGDSNKRVHPFSKCNCCIGAVSPSVTVPHFCRRRACSDAKLLSRLRAAVEASPSAAAHIMLAKALVLLVGAAPGGAAAPFRPGRPALSGAQLPGMPAAKQHGDRHVQRHAASHDRCLVRLPCPVQALETGLKKGSPPPAGPAALMAELGPRERMRAEVRAYTSPAGACSRWPFAQA